MEGSTLASSSQPDVSGSHDRRIVIVVGPGRSGTSTIAGALAKSGLEIPGEAIGGNKTNPSGFFEPRWVVDFHKELLERGRVATMDAAPEALDRAAEVADSPEVRSTLQDWLAGRLDEQPRLVVKDPRTVWFRDLWVDTARELGVEPGFVTMLRHPAEVSASREKYYRKGERDKTRADDIRRIAGWTNVALIAEQVTQGSPRSFVKYTDLVGDWRAVLSRLARDLDLTFDPPVERSPHPVDEFIDPSLHRVRVEWDDVEVPHSVRDAAEDAWQALTTLADGSPPGDAAERVDRVRAAYLQLTEDALALNGQSIRRLEAAARRQARRQLRKQYAANPPGRSGAGPAALWRRLTGNTR
jgi:hypothetical protein